MIFASRGGFQVRLFAGFALVIVLALGSVSFYVMQGAEQEIEVYDDLTDQLHLTRMEHWLLGYHARGDSWENVRASVEEMGVLSGRRIILTDPSDEVIIDSRYGLTGAVFEEEWTGRELTSYRGIPLGTLYVGPGPTVATAYKQDLARSIGFFLFWGSLAALAAALALTALLARRLTAPMRILVNAARRIGTGDFTGYIDIRERGEFAELATAFNAMAHALSQAAAFRKNFVADIAHELRTPLSNIRGYIEAAEDGLVSSGEAIATVKDDALMLHRLVDDLQELALADSGTLNMAYRLWNPVALVEKVVASMGAAARAEGVALNWSRPEEDPPEIVVDAQRIAQVIRNLLENAIMHTPRGGRVQVTMEAVPEGVTIAVKDSGPGIPEEELERIFERFHRVDKSRARATGGSGLGLTISRHLVEAHHGTIAAANSPDGGSIFSVTLPLIPDKR
ncbi:MAG: HAMP domain-containing protein [Spirochaetaceae bacterium]|nr:MAG: HAMP domain-containing protein [Spirochaetaceae bacterium]